MAIIKSLAPNTTLNQTTLGKRGSDGLSGVYWVGSNGQVYTQGNNGQVTQVGSASGTGAGLTTLGGVWNGVRRIADPNAPKATTPVNDVVGDVVGGGGGGGGGGGSSFIDTSAARGATQQGITALDTTLGNNLNSIAANYNRIIEQYTAEEALNKENYGKQTTSNEQTRESTIQAALLAAAQGGRGLRATLGAIGANNGTGALLANRAVAQGANADIGNGNKTFDNNATQLYEAYATTQQEEKNRRAEAAAAKINEEKATRATVAKEKQSLFEKMAGLWTDSGNNAEAAKYIGMAGNMSGEIAGYSGSAVAPYTPRSVTYKPGELKGYLAGANDMTVKTSGGNSKASANSALYTTTRKREELL